MFSIPFEPQLFGFTLPVHLILEYLSVFVGFRYYLYLRKNGDDHISSGNRLSIILGAIIGAFLGSRLMGFLEHPALPPGPDVIWYLMNNKTIMGGLFGGLIGVETAKKMIGETRSSGDLFTLPLILSIFIGRIGCFLSGTTEFTYGSETTFFTGMDLGDGLLRHPTSLYEIIFLILLFSIIRRVGRNSALLQEGDLFKAFMIIYFGFRFFIEFIKPNVFFVTGLSSIQWLCIACWGYYVQTIIKAVLNARKTVHLLRLHH